MWRFLLISTLLFTALTSPAQADELPEIDRAVVDLAGVFTTIEANDLSSTLHAHHERTGVQMAILTLDTTGELPIEDFSLRVAQDWSGGSAERNDGVLLIFAIEDRESRLEVGYGLEEWLPDRQASRLLRSANSSLRGERYAEGARLVVDGVVEDTRHLKAGGSLAPPLGHYQWLFLPILFYLGVVTGYQWRLKAPEIFDKQRRIALNIALWIGTPLLVAFIFRHGYYLWLAMSVFWISMVALGASINFRWHMKNSFVNFLLTAVPLIFFLFSNGSFVLAPIYLQLSGPDGFELLEFIGMISFFWLYIMFIGFVAGFAIYLPLSFLSRFLPEPEGGVGGSSTYSSGGIGSSNFSSGSSNFSSGSSSFSSGSNSSSFSSGSSSRSYSGGGGSFGGGGATSRW